MVLLWVLFLSTLYVVSAADLTYSVYSSHVFETMTVAYAEQCSDACKNNGQRCASFVVKKLHDSHLVCELNECEPFNVQGKQDMESSLRHLREQDSSSLYAIAVQQIRSAQDESYCSLPISFTTQEEATTYVNRIGTEAKTCSDIKQRNSTTTSGHYVIDPDGPEGLAPFTVFCNMTYMGGVGVTFISHDSEARTEVMHAPKAPGSYARHVTYINASVAQLAELTRVSLNCRQFIKWECHKNKFLSRGYAWWVSRDDQRMNYWGGASPGSGNCACGETNSCALSTEYRCNCEVEDAVWRSDEGFLSDKSTLPVLEMRFADTDSKKERGFHTLEKFFCYG